jgi:acetolactate synthase-1/2/3 large subunit
MVIKMKVKVSDYIADFLVKSGVRHVFMVTGGGAMHLDDSLGKNPGLNCIFNHHEQACTMAAEGYTRYSGKLAAVCVTSGPGGTNALTGVIWSWHDSIPAFVISGPLLST